MAQPLSPSQPLVFDLSEVQKKLLMVDALRSKLDIYRTKIVSDEQAIQNNPNSANLTEKKALLAKRQNLLDKCYTIIAELENALKRKQAELEKTTDDGSNPDSMTIDLEVKHIGVLFTRLGKKAKKLRDYIQQDFGVNASGETTSSAASVNPQPTQPAVQGTPSAQNNLNRSSPQTPSKFPNQTTGNSLTPGDGRPFRGADRSSYEIPHGTLAKHNKELDRSHRNKLEKLEETLNEVDHRVLQNVLLALAKENDEMFTKITASLNAAHIASPSTNATGSRGSKPLDDDDHHEEKSKKSHHKGHKRGASITGVLSSPSEDPESHSKKKVNTTLAVKDVRMKGILHVKDKKNKWKKKFAMVNEENLYLFKSNEDEKPPEIVSLSCGSVRLSEDGKKLHFTLLTPASTLKFQADSEKEVLQWTATIDDICNNIMHKNIGTEQMNAAAKRNSMNLNAPVGNNNITQEKQELLNLWTGANKICVDCGAKDPEWVSINLGVFMCIECSGAHRNLGTHVSKVRSIQYDHMERDQIHMLASLGNLKANAMWEGNLPPNVKPSERDPLNTKSEFIRAKYADMAYVNPADKSKLLALMDQAPESSINNSISAEKKHNSWNTKEHDQEKRKSLVAGFRKSTGVSAMRELEQQRKKDEKREKEEKKEKEKEEKKEKKQAAKAEEEKKPEQKERDNFRNVLNELTAARNREMQQDLSPRGVPKTPKTDEKGSSKGGLLSPTLLGRKQH